jgi:hypothetical protein
MEPSYIALLPINFKLAVSGTGIWFVGGNVYGIAVSGTGIWFVGGTHRAN